MPDATLTRRVLLQSAAALAGLPAFGAGPGKGLVIILLGSPGAGKTTQAKLLKEHYRIPYLSAPEILRKSHGKKSRISRGLASETASGELLSDDALNDLMLENIKKADFSRGFILDGYPATKKQAAFLSRAVEDMGLDAPAAVVLAVPEAVARERMLRRGRADDAPANVERRLAQYELEIATVRAEYPAARVIQLDGTKQPAALATEIRQALEALR